MKETTEMPETAGPSEAVKAALITAAATLTASLIGRNYLQEEALSDMVNRQTGQIVVDTGQLLGHSWREVANLCAEITHKLDVEMRRAGPLWIRDAG